MAAVDPSALEPWSALALRRSLRDRRSWLVAIVLGGLTATIAGLVGTTGSPASVLVFAVVPIMAVALVLAALVQRGEVLAAAALLAALSPALQALSGGRWQGAAAVVAAGSAVVLPRAHSHVGPRLRLTAAAALSLVLLVVWIRRTPDAPVSPSWATVVSDTGRRLWETVGTIAQLTRMPTSAWLAWWLAVGVIMGAGVVIGHWRAALVATGGVAGLVVTGWLIVNWRGTVDMSGGMWIVSGSIAFAGATVRLEPDAERRIASSVTALLAVAWALTLIHLVRL